ncbi:RimK family protein [Pleionea litopenaei]|uniref:RimK family protein n=1 Tax=Pleionea litopenaei TaxID=3070815 RepID=A0AA51X781_9GAMM|nr:RimK family protein [Pleionea sp. HL-JVS1]WMS86830.1 RimK family protein [Pleionea sp. HL-JVS1]
MYKTLFVVDDSNTSSLPAGAISFADYLRDYPKLGEPKTRIINLCDTSRYLSQGYYCSLLAEARHHVAMPSVKTINALRADGAFLWLKYQQLKNEAAPTEPVQLIICMGSPLDGNYPSIAARIFREWPAPLLKVDLVPETKGIRAHVQRLSLNQLSDAEQTKAVTTLERNTSSRWQKHKDEKKFRWEMAMLVNKSDKVPPSNKGALDRFVKAGAKLGIAVHPVEAHELANLNQYDALFIRETTAINHITYQLACRAEELGLVVMDDTDSILRCCNKVYLHDAYNYQKVPSLKTEFILDNQANTLDQLEQTFGYPLVIKMPEGSFSKGVYKVKSRQELEQLTSELLNESAMLLVQEYLFTEYDWRIGIINGRAIYACRYYMARNHWQIYNHGSSRNFSGGFDALPTFEVPRQVLKAALKAAAVIGNGLYGVDLKEVDGKAYVLEVNDNPSIDHNVEDAYLGDELYMQVMGEFLRRLEQRGQ